MAGRPKSEEELMQIHKIPTWLIQRGRDTITTMEESIKVSLIHILAKYRIGQYQSIVVGLLRVYHVGWD